MNRYLNYLKKVNEHLNFISDKEDASLCRLYLDYAYCLFRHGCLINQYSKGHFYKQSGIIRAKSFTQRRVTKIINRYNDPRFIHILENKNEFNSFFSEFMCRKWLYSKEMTKEQFNDFISKCKKIFVKPLDDMEGHGICFLDLSDRNTDDIFDNLKKRNAILEEPVVQNRMLDLGNKSVNTARILTVTDSLGKAHVISAGLRAGTGDSVIDNFSAGGVLYEIDIETGRIDHKGIQGDNYDVIFHPGSDICMLGFKLPNWEKAVASVIKAAENLPECRFIGWDVAFTESGVELIEGNHNPGIFTLESLGTTGVYAVAMKILADKPKTRTIASGIKRYKRDIEEFRRELGGGEMPTLSDCIWSYIRYGCVLNHYLYGKFYKLSRSDRKKAFTYRHWAKIVPKVNNPDYIHFLKNKVNFNILFAEYLNRDWLFTGTMTLDEFTDFYRKHNEAIIKPMDGLEGVGIYLKTFTGKEDLPSLYIELKDSNSLIEEKIIQHPQMIFGNKSVNTIRVYTIYNAKENKVEILKTVVRAGIGESIVDNSHSGGCAYEVNRDSGVIISKSYCANGVETDIHPGTDIKMTGRVIPFWSEVIRLCINAAFKLKECKFIGWDVAITEKGPLLIEGNHTPDLDMVEFVGSHGYLPTIKGLLNL